VGGETPTPRPRRRGWGVLCGIGGGGGGGGGAWNRSEALIKEGYVFQFNRNN